MINQMYNRNIKYLCHIIWSKSIVYMFEILILFLLIKDKHYIFLIFFSIIFGLEEFFASKKIQDIESKTIQ